MQAPYPPGRTGNIRRHRWRHPTPSWGRYGAVVLAVLVGFSGCHATVGRVIGQQFVSPGYAFEVPLPGDEWTVRRDEPAVLALAHSDLRAGISISVTCDRDDQAPLSVLARHLFFGLKEVDILGQEPRDLDGVPALYTVARARLDRAEVQVDSYVARYQGCVYDLVYVANPRDYPRGEPGFARMLAGFHFRSR